MGQQFLWVELAAADWICKLGTQRCFPQYVRVASTGFLLLFRSGIGRFHVTPCDLSVPRLAKLCFCERNSYFLKGTWMKLGILLKTQRHIIIHLSLLHPCDVSCFASWDTGVMMRSFSETEVDDEWRWRNHTFKKLAQVSVTGMESFCDQAMWEEHE